eukprot:CAMPEP_0117447496 /NCGR_PEP_ID=MMETSP0759-20121206/6907_1 /TAXON_ID=63605 /ORGANISM="Percolomonas cosmopolitus, Strain WS" /LENGTH=184 /DNA_ID=CAMNT_0005239837 /DNA_START=45 /DNA_END=599 /DNA_ORIENTATION=-
MSSSNTNTFQTDQKLIFNLQQQITRLTDQLAELEEYKAELDADEYDEIKQETLQELKEVQETADKMAEGNLTLLDSLGAAALAMRAAVSNAFHTPEILCMFAKAQPAQLRNRFDELQRDYKLGKVPKDEYTQQTIEVLAALQRLGERLSDQEEQFLRTNMTENMKNFAELSNDVVLKENVIVQK